MDSANVYVMGVWAFFSQLLKLPITYCYMGFKPYVLIIKNLKMSDTEYLYYHLDFFKDGNYQFECVAKDLDDVRGYLQWWEVEFDDENTKAEIRIKGIGLTKKAFEALKKEQRESE